jgi:hypothetical protein
LDQLGSLVEGEGLTELFGLLQFAVGVCVLFEGALKVGDDEQDGLLLGLVVDLGAVRGLVEGLHGRLEVLHLVLITILHRQLVPVPPAHAIVHVLLGRVIILHPLILIPPLIVLLKLIPLILLSLRHPQILIPMRVSTTYPVFAEI